MTSYEWKRSEGIVMQVLPFQDADAIFTVYTHDLGFAKFVLKYALSSRQRGKGVPSPLALTEFIYRPTSGELLSCKEATVLDSFHALRKNLSLIEAGGALLKALYQTQPLGKVSDKLYKLLLVYLDKLPQVEDPKVLVASFKLKILRYEGVLTFHNQNLDHLEGFHPEEAKMLFVMALTQSLGDLKPLLLTAPLEEKIDQLFKEFSAG